MAGYTGAVPSDAVQGRRGWTATAKDDDDAASELASGSISAVTTQIQPRYIQQAIQRHLQPPHVTEEWLEAGGIAVDCSRSLNSPVTSDSTGGQILADVRTR